MISGTLWNLLNWLLLGLVAWLIGAVAIGDLIKVYWIPRTMLVTRWMLTPRSMQWAWLVIFLSTSFSAWLVWKEHSGGWASSPVKLSLYVILTLFSTLWFLVLYVLMSLRGALLLAFINVLLAIVVAILFHAANVTAGIIVSLCILWYIYIVAWCYYLRQINRGKTHCVNPDFTFVFQQDPVGLPHPSTWKESGRICPYEVIYQKFEKIPISHSPNVAGNGPSDDQPPLLDSTGGVYSSSHAGYNYGAKQSSNVPGYVVHGDKYHHYVSNSITSHQQQQSFPPPSSQSYNNQQHTNGISPSSQQSHSNTAITNYGANYNPSTPISTITHTGAKYPSLLQSTAPSSQLNYQHTPPSSSSRLPTWGSSTTP